METQQILLLILTGILAGFIAGGFGVGGGIIIVPALLFVFGLSQHEAQGTSFAVLLFPIGILGVWNYYKNGFVNMKFVIILVIAFVLGSYFGSLVSIHLPAKTLKKAFAILMLVVGTKMLFEK
jgi:uncharacterized protein